MKSMLLTLLAAGLLIVVAPLSTACALQDEGKKPDEPTPESIQALREVVDNLHKAIKEKSDVDKVHYLGQVGGKYGGGDGKTKASAVKVVSKLAKSKNKDVRSAAIKALGQTGGKAAKTLLRLARSYKKDVTAVCECLRACGKLQDAKSVKELTKYLYNKDNTVIAQTISALGDYIDAPTSVRKEIVEALIKVYEPVASAANKSNPQTSDKTKYDLLYNPFESALKALTRETSVDGANNWGRWFRKTGEDKKEW